MMLEPQNDHMTESYLCLAGPSAKGQAIPDCSLYIQHSVGV